MAYQSFLPEERAELARRLRDGMINAHTSADAQAAALDIAVTYALEVAVRFTNEQNQKVIARYEREIADLRRLVDQVCERVDVLQQPGLRVVNGK